MRPLLLALVLCSGCASTGVFLSYDKTGLVLVQADTEFGKVVSDAPMTRRGEACSTNILGIVSLGDSSLGAAAQDGNIRHIGTIDYRITRVLGLYGELCTIVWGSGDGVESSPPVAMSPSGPVLSSALPSSAAPTFGHEAIGAQTTTGAQNAVTPTQDQQDASLCREATRRLCFLRYRARWQADASFPDTELGQKMSQAVCYLPRGCLADWPDEGDPRVRDVAECPGNDPNCLPAAAHYLAAYGQQSDDLTVAMRLYVASCRQGDPESCTDYGVLLMVSSGDEERQLAAHAVLTQACDRNDGRACAILGFMALEKSDDAHKEEARSLLLKACDHKQAEACRQLGLWTG